MGPLPAPGSRPSSKASSLPVVTIPRTISSGWGGSVAPPIFTPSDATSWVSIGFVSSATTRLHWGQRNAAASVPSPGSWRSSNAIWRSHSTHRNFTGGALPLVHTLKRGPSRRTSYTCHQSVPHFRCGMPGNAREQRDPDLSSQRIACVSRERAARHVLDDSEAPGAAVARRTQGAAHGILGLLGRNGDGDDRWRLGQQLGELGEALHPGRQIDEQQVQPAPRHVRQELAQRRGLEGPAPHEALRLGAPERERTAILEQQRHREAAHALRAHRRLDNPVVRRATGNREAEQLGGSGAVQVRVEHAHGPSGPAEGTGQMRRHEALAHAPFAAHHRHDPGDRRQPLGHAPPLSPDLVGQAGAVGLGQVVVGTDVERHDGKKMRCRLLRRYVLQRSVVASGHATFPVTMIDELKQRLQAEVERLNHEINFVLPKEIEKARAHGDLRENSEYKAALERQQFAQARASHLRLRLSKLSSVKEEDIPRDRVGFGSRVTVQDVDTKKRETYALTLGEFIEGDDNPAELPVSMASPLGKALLGGKVGQTVAITLPLGKRRLKIVELATVHDLAERKT